jgi:methyl-accepting chemotaxis protein
MNKLLSNLKISAKLIVGFGISVLLLGVVLFTGISSLSKVNDEVTVIVDDLFPKTVIANEMIDAVNDNARALRNMIISNDKAIEYEALDRFKKATELVTKHVNSLTETIKSEKGKELLAAMQKVRTEQYFPARERLLNEYNAGNMERVNELLFGEMRDAQNKYLSSLKDIINFQTELVVLGGNSVHEAYSTAFITMLVVGIIALIFVIIFAWLITKNIVRPVTMVQDRMMQLESVCLTNLGDGLNLLSKGDLSKKLEKSTQKLNLDQKDEIGQMAKVFDSMLIKAQGGIDAYETTRGTIVRLSQELGKVIEDAKNGLLDNRGDENKFEGVYKELIGGLNQTLDAVILPVQDGAKILEVMTTGDFTPRVTADYKGQHRMIKDSINKLGDSISRILKEVTDAVQATASSSTQISSSSEEMAAGAQEQSAQTTEIAGAIEQMTSTILQTTKNASTAAEQAKSAGLAAEEGGIVIRETIEGMNRIADVVKNAAQTVHELGASSEQIGTIVQVIDDIADQTNLLALNAAIEAARAGEQGRGFAVVADEVRKLAERTTKATKEIGDMIKKIQKDTGGAVKSMELGTSEVEKGIKYAEKSGKSLNEIIVNANTVVDVINQVAAASEEQSSAAEQISRSIEGISSVTHQSAAGVQQIAKAAGDLNNLTVDLQNLVEQFKISEDVFNHQPVLRSEAKNRLADRSNRALLK